MHARTHAPRACPRMHASVTPQMRADAGRHPQIAYGTGLVMGTRPGARAHTKTRTRVLTRAQYADAIILDALSL